MAPVEPRFRTTRRPEFLDQVELPVNSGMALFWGRAAARPPTGMLPDMSQTPAPSPTSLGSLEEALRLTAEAFERFWRGILIHAPQLLAASLVLLAGLALARAAARGAEKALTRADPAANTLPARLVFWALSAVAIALALAAAGVNLFALMTGLGLAGLGAGLALQEFLANLVAGVVILVERPFVRGDYVQGAGGEGRVEEVRARSTLLRSDDGRLVVVPNRLLLAGPLVNAASRPPREVPLVLGESTDPRKTLEEVERVLANHPAVSPSPPPALLLRAWNRGTIEAALRFAPAPGVGEEEAVNRVLLDLARILGSHQG